MTLAQCLVLSILVSIVASSPTLEIVPWVSTDFDLDEGLYIHTFRNGPRPIRPSQVMVEETLLFDSPMPFEHEYVHKWPRNGISMERINGTEVKISTDSSDVTVSSTKAGENGVKLVVKNSPTLSKSRITIRHFADPNIYKKAAKSH